MDRITAGLLKEFTEEFQLGEVAEGSQFEHFAAWLTVRAPQNPDCVSGRRGTHRERCG